jgi:TonB-dependent SusC/RagA subfamily outer membrane receptor
LHSYAQKDLSRSLRKSAYTYIYQLTPKQALLFHQKGLSQKSAANLSNPKDSFLTGSKLPSLSPGNYLLILAADNKLVHEQRTAPAVQAKVLNNKNDVTVLVHHEDGSIEKTAKVLLAGKKLAFDSATQTYRLNNTRRSGTLEVYYQNILHLFNVDNGVKRNTLWQKTIKSRPVKFIVKASRLQHTNRGYYSYFHSKTRWEEKFRGYMVFNKPMYKPGDTVQIKAFITTKKGKPVDRSLLLRLTDQSFLTDTILTTLKPYRKGGYTGSFVLNDKMDLDLDQAYLLTLEEQSSRKYNLDTYDGDLDEDEYALKRKVLMRGIFRLEEYELGSASFAAKADKQEHHRGEQVTLYLKATDENGLAVMDGRVSIEVLTHGNNQHFHAPKVFLPDTLWRHEQSLEAIGETKILLPDSIFPAASFPYSIQSTFRNSNNELHTETLYQHYRYKPENLTFQLNEDSLHIGMEISGKSQPAIANLLAFNRRGDTIHHQALALPGAIRYHPFAQQYQVSAGGITDFFTPTGAQQMVACQAERTHDSIWIKVQNEHHLPLWYTLFAGKKAVFRGTGDTLLYIGGTKTPRNYYLSLQYVAGDQMHTKEYPIPYQDKLLYLNVEQPQFIYPGQQTAIAIQLTDKKGKPVPDADITAYAFTQKFSNVRPPYVPYYGRIYGQRKMHNDLSLSALERPAMEQQLAWKRWSREMGLDTIEYFRFLYPETLYQNYEPAKDSITQLAPFVVREGQLQPIHLLFIDEQPVFFSGSQHLQRYSFAVGEGKHSLRLRTHNSMIYVDSFHAKKGMKTFFSINADTSNKYIRIEKMPDTLTRHEQELWTRYMILVENIYEEKPAYITQGNTTYSLNLGKTEGQFGGSLQLVGPLVPTSAQLVAKNRFRQQFEVEGGFQYRIREGFVRQKLTGNALLPKSLPHNTKPVNFKDYVLTEKEIDSLWQQYLDQRSAHSDLFYNPRLPKGGNGKLEIAVAKDDEEKEVFVKNIILFRNDDPDFVRIYKGSERFLGHLKPGQYRLMLLFPGDTYFIKEHIYVQPNGTNFYNTGTIATKPKDSISERIAGVINNRELARRMDNPGDVNQIKETFHDAYLDSSAFTHRVEGLVQDENQRPVTGAIVRVKGSKVSTITDDVGYFSLLTPGQAVLVISSIGYSTAEIRSEANFMEVSMLTAKYALQEVVVVGYGTQRKANMTGAASVTSFENVLSGRTAGVNIRGAATIGADAKPLIIIDGVPYSGSMESLDPALIANVSVLKDASATAIYGSAAANGVVVITTRKAVQEGVTNDFPPTQNSLRSNFHDYAYWQPQLKTDQNGRAVFTTTFPDDITNWRGFAIAMASKKRSGFAETSVRSFKALSGVINLPLFLTWNDTVNIIGKTQYYLPDSVSVRRSFSVNDTLMAQNIIQVKAAWIDTFAVKAAAGDSIKFKYTLQKAADGYFDGEERKLPLVRPGTLETNGMFAALEGDTTFSLTITSADGPVKLYAEASLLPVLLDETEQIRSYQYLCNEQLASKLKALLMQQKIYKHLNNPFNRQGEINEIISRLHNAKANNGLWGWWSNNQPAFWISRHAVEALLAAEQSGYKINLNKQALTDNLVFSVEESRGMNKLETLSLLHALKAKVDYSRHLDSLDKDATLESKYAQLRLLELKQQLELNPRVDTLLQHQHRTIMGNLYWGEEGYRFFDNAIQHTLIVYRLLRQTGSYSKELQKMRNYFLEQRRSGNWRNTYESSLILETILPDLLRNDSLPRPASLTILGKDSIQVNKFPYTAELKDSNPLQIKKAGDLPVYFTAYQQQWNPSPEKVTSDFVVSSGFAKDASPRPVLTAGQPVALEVKVVVKADADYVLIEVPIPAGCSYQDKPQSWRNNEVHREYFKHKVSIFCSQLKKGEYTFSVPLLPRFTGTYHLNPARAELMYFPVFFGREGMKQVKIY